MSSYYDEQPQASDPLGNPRVVTAIVLGIAGLVAIIGCVGLYFFIGRGSASAQPTVVVTAETLPTNTPTLTPIPSDTTAPSPTLEGTGGGGGEEETPTPDLTLTLASASPIRYANLSEIRGLVEYKNDTVGDWKAATGDISIPAGTMIRTSENSTVKITLTEGTVIRVGSQTQFTLSQMSGSSADPTTTLNLDFGKLWNVVANTPGATNYEVVTTLGKASVRGGSFMSTEHNTGDDELDITTCLESKKGCSYAVDGVGVQTLATGEMLIYRKGGGSLSSPDKMDQGQLNDWAPTRVPEVLTLTPTPTSTGTITPTRTPSITRTPSNTPNRDATDNAGGTKTAIAATSTALAGSNSGTQTQAAVNQTATQNSGNLTATVYFFNVTATALFQSTSNSFTATSFAFTSTAFAATSNFNGTNSANTSTAVAATSTAAAIPRFSFSSATTSINENSTPLTVTINVSPACAVACSVQVRAENQTALNGGALPSDYTYASPTTVNFLAGQTSATTSVTILDDPNTTEADETFQLVLQNPSGGGSTLGATTIMTVTIRDVVVPTLNFDSGSYNPSVNEGTGLITLTARLSASVSYDVPVVVSFTNLTAVGGADFDNTAVTSPTGTGALTFNIPANQTTATFDVTIYDDGTSESNETFQVGIACSGACPGAVLQGPNRTSTVTIVNQAPPSVAFSSGTYAVTEGNAGTSTTTITVNLSRAYANTRTVTVDYSTFAGGTATGGGACGGSVDYVTPTGTLTFVPGDMTENITVTICGDTTYEPDETVFLQLTSPTFATLGVASSTLTINNDDLPPNLTYTVTSAGGSSPTEPGGLGGTFTLAVDFNLAAASGIDVSFNYATAANTATDGQDYVGRSGLVTILAGSTTATVNFTIKGDVLNEISETFNISLSNITNATLTSPNPLVITIVDDGDTAPTPAFSLSPYYVVEGNSGTTFVQITINFDRPSGQNIILGYYTADGGGSVACNTNPTTAGIDYTPTSGTISFPQGTISNSFTVPVFGDTVFEPDECMSINLNLVSGTALGLPTSTELWILNDDT